MPRPEIYFEGESEESDFSETDMSIRGRNGRTAFHRRSVSRHRHPEVARETYLAPVQQSTRVYRSASTGGRRPREHSSTPAVMIVNEQATRTSNANTNKPRRVQQRVYDESDEEVPRSARRRAASGVSREASPLQQQRDYELLMSQRMLEKSDMHQDMEIWKHQQEIERLERELEKTREKTKPPREIVAAPAPPPPPPARESRLLRDEEEWYEDEISERLHRLQRFERKNRAEEERRQAEHRWRLQKFEEAEKDAANREDLKAKLRAEKLKEIERQQEENKERERLRLELEEQKLKELQKAKEEEEEREKLKKEILAEEARKAAEAAEERKKQLALKAAAVAEWKLEQERMAQQKKEEAERKDKEFRERLRIEFGYSEEEIEEILKKKKEAKKEEKKEDKIEFEETKKTTWIKVHRKHLLPETLMAYSLPWDWDERDTNYIIIKRWVTEDFQEELFAHSRRLREGKVIAQTSSSTTELRVNDRNKDKMYLVRKKSPSRRLRMFA
ncbi:hypothetical protein N7448_001280 [Penicillium atrosanguineum]|uniref:Uncharacterized protein n=1 Tax=Penicillium atrosanguineum TaxID=1132637 RepID=A0A9W9HJV6_9EURO|nr:uncharacterized protein N7443_004680 [Penicillium atrosanguineum]KAJ5133696.1 hypothetical protein N7526_005061 [Penicillium atrosanguineum]KAJ5149702.1 hypothetical protein N7448_001280 [Penicillium atrosanguineum]KAJ5305020.1 hypothetical protein N7443_004680 [Penicillium atrosanguineum]KAJ5324486.1 hypothetical protein N7476_003086 [Penicillium atrosanguineum]